MHAIQRLLLLGVIFFLSACGEWFSTSLPFPTPAQHDLDVLIAEGPLTYAREEGNGESGLEHDLIEAFAQELGVGVRYIVVPAAEIESRIANGEAHLAAAWLPPPTNSRLKSSSPIVRSRDILIQHEASLPLSEIGELAGKTVHVLAGSRQAATLQGLRATIPDLQIVEEKEDDVFDLLEAVGERQLELVAIDSALVDIATQFTPNLQATLELGDEQAIVWQLGPKPNAELQARLFAFIEHAQLDGTLSRIEDRYFGHVRRLKQPDIVKFLGQIESVLPKLRQHFLAGQASSGIDWRLIAAVAYHESHWDPNATSPTGVRGIMMLTEDTADRLGVSNRLDSRESILAGARYINMLKEQQPAEVVEPDRSWLALAAYNIGPGHFNAARTLARQRGIDPNTWYEMKRVLPLLAQPKYYQRLKSGRARGGEAVILVENIRAYYDILLRNEAPYREAAGIAQEISGTLNGNPGLKLRR